MNDDELDKQESSLRQNATELINASKLESLLSPFGGVNVVGSYKAMLMVKPDIDIIVYTEEIPEPKSIIGLASPLYAVLPGLFQLEFYDNKHHGADGVYYLGAKTLYNGMDWQIDITFCMRQDSYFDPRVEAWTKDMSNEQRLIVLKLKAELIDKGRYLGASSEPPQSFRSINVYEGVFEGGARSIADLEEYFTKKS